MLIAPEFKDGDVVSVLLEKMAYFHLEPRLVGADSGVRQGDFDTITELILKVGIDDFSLFALDQLHQQPQRLARAFQHRQRYVPPPVVGLDRLDQS